MIECAKNYYWTCFQKLLSHNYSAFKEYQNDID